MSHVVAIDPGLSTGVAEFIGDRCVASFTTEAPHAELNIYLRATVDEKTEVVCEQGPVHRRQPEACSPVEEIVRERAETIHWVRPTDWKGHPSSKLVEGDNPKTRHERDAIRMGRWWLARRSPAVDSTC